MNVLPVPSEFVPALLYLPRDPSWGMLPSRGWWLTPAPCATTAALPWDLKSVSIHWCFFSSRDTGPRREAPRTCLRMLLGHEWQEQDRPCLLAVL